MSETRIPKVGEMVLFHAVADRPTREIHCAAIVLATSETDPRLEGEEVHLVTFHPDRESPRWVRNVNPGKKVAGYWSFREESGS